MFLRNGFPRAGSTYDRIGSLRPDSTNGCTGSSTVPKEQDVHVTSVTCGGLFSKRICLRIVSVELHASVGMVLQQHRKNVGIVECQSSVLCDRHVIEWTASRSGLLECF